MAHDFATSNGFSTVPWLFDQNDFLRQPSLDEPFGFHAADVVAGDSLLAPYASFAPGEYLLDPSIGPAPAASGDNLGAPSPPAPMGRYNCIRLSCSNNNGEGFQRPSDLKRHHEKHEKRHKCSDCTWQFGSKADLERHGREVHGKPADNGKPCMHFCPEKSCKRNKRGFPRLWNMQQHYVKMHGGPAPSTSSSPTSDAVETPLISSSGESAPTTPPSSVDEPHTPCPRPVADQGDQGIVRGLIVSRLRELQTQRKEHEHEADRLRTLLRQMGLEGTE